MRVSGLAYPLRSQNCPPSGRRGEGCTPTEIAHFVDTGDHSNFWGVYLHDHPDGNTYILGSDRDSGLWIFADPLS